MRVSIIQNEIKWGGKDTNLTSFGSLVESVYGKTDLVVLPEMFSTGFAVDKPYLSEDEGGEAFSLTKKWAKDGNFAVSGSIMAKDGDNYVNRGFITLPDGTMQTADKRHLFVGDEKRLFTNGNKILTVSYLGAKIRLLICYDLRFPVWSRYTADNPYDILIYCANWPKDRIDAWDSLLKARAIENQAFVCAANAVGVDGYKIHHNGHSAIFGIRGENLLAFEDYEIGVKTIELDLNFQKKIREKIPFLKDNDSFILKKL